MACQIPSSLVKQRGLLLWLTGLAIVYQIFYRIFMSRAVSERDAAEDGCSSDGAATPRCIELSTFRDWHRSAPLLHDLRVLRVDDLDSDEWPMDAALNASLTMMDAAPNASLTTATTPAPPVGATAGRTTAAGTSAPDAGGSSLPAAAAEMETTARSPVTAWAKGLMQLQQHQEELSAALDRRAEAIIMQTSAEPGNFTQWPQGSAPSQAQRVIKTAEIPSSEHLRAAGSTTAVASAEADASFHGNAVADIPSSEQLRTEGSATAAAGAEADASFHGNAAASGGAPSRDKKPPSTLTRHIDALLVEMCEEPQRRHREDCVKILAERARDVRADRHQQQMQALRDQQHQLHADLEAVAIEGKAWQRAFAERVDAAHKEMCESPQSQRQPDCIKFLASVAAVEREKSAALRAARRVSRAALRSNITKEAKERAAMLDRKLGDLVVHRRAWEQELLRKYDAVARDVPTTAPQQHVDAEAGATVQPGEVVDQQAREMHWSSARDWAAKGRQLRGSARGRVVLSRKDVRSAHWAGMIPKVACITVVKSSLAAKIQMKYVVENFNKQKYEGPTQLVLVYHHNDHEAADLVKVYADGVHIKGVASQNDAAEFPSTLDLRYGAWSATDADIIAHWTFDEWHHPHQLSSQVRALALAARPASMLVHAAHGAAEGAPLEAPAVYEDTVVGEARWMHEHWHPMLKEERSFIESARAVDIVEVDLRV